MRLLLVLLLVRLYEVARRCIPQFQPPYWFVVGVYGTRVVAGVFPSFNLVCRALLEPAVYPREYCSSHHYDEL